MSALPIVTRTREEVIRLWVKALRSGEYRQHRDELRNDNAFCCLGVLCDLAAKDGGDQWRRGTKVFRYQDQGGIAPVEFERFLFGHHHRAQIFRRLANLNDSGHTFCEIANEIEMLA